MGILTLKDGNMTNTEIALQFLGWQGGTIHQVADKTGLSVKEILEADNIESLIIESLVCMKHADRLFSGYFPCGIVWADRVFEHEGDYKKLAFLSYGTLELDLYDCPKELRDNIIADARSYQERKGEQLKIANMTITLGHAIDHHPDLRDDLNPRILKDITNLGWTYSEIKKVGDSRSFELNETNVWECIHGNKGPMWARADLVDSHYCNHSYHYELLDAIRNENGIK